MLDILSPMSNLRKKIAGAESAVVSSKGRGERMGGRGSMGYRWGSRRATEEKGDSAFRRVRE